MTDDSPLRTGAAPFATITKADLGYPIWTVVTRLSSRKFRLPLNRLEARLFAQGIEERVSLQLSDMARPHCRT